MKYTRLILLGIIFIAIMLRFWNLGEIPSGMTEDEKIYIYNSYSIWHTQRDIAGEYLPLAFNHYNSFSPVPVYLIAPFVGLFDLSLFTARLPFAIMGVLDIWLLFLIAKRLFHKDSIALASSAVLAISPWHLQFSRIAYDGAAALFFYLCGLYLFLRLKERGNILFSLPFFLLGFYSYHATKIFLLVLVPILLITYWSNLKESMREVFLFIAGVLIILLSFLFVSSTQGVNRQQVLLYNDTANLAKTVNTEREYSSAPDSLKPFFSNKISIVTRTIKENYLHAFSPEYLFIKGETGYSRFIYGTGMQGVMYLIELPILLLGIWYILHQKRRVRNLILAALLFAPVPAAITLDQSYGMRSIMMLPFLSILTGCGIVFIFIKTKAKRRVLHYVLLGLLLTGYLFSVSSNLYQYHFLYNQFSAESWHRSSRDLAEYLADEGGQYKRIFVTANESFLLHYATYARSEPKLTQKAYQSSLPINIGNVSLIGTCFDKNTAAYDPREHYPSGSLYIVNSDCHKKSVTEPIYKIIDRSEHLHPIWDVYKL